MEAPGVFLALILFSGFAFVLLADYGHVHLAGFALVLVAVVLALVSWQVQRLSSSWALRLSSWRD